MKKKQIADLVPSYRGQINIARVVSQKLGLHISDKVFSNLENNFSTPEENAVPVLDIKLESPVGTLKAILEIMECRHEKCLAPRNVLDSSLRVLSLTEWNAGISWKFLDIEDFWGRSTTYVRNVVSPLNLPTSSVGWLMHYMLRETDGDTIPFLKAVGFHIENGFGRETIGFQSIESVFNIRIVDVNEKKEHWSNPVLV